MSSQLLLPLLSLPFSLPLPRLLLLRTVGYTLCRADFLSVATGEEKAFFHRYICVQIYCWLSLYSVSTQGTCLTSGVLPSLACSHTLGGIRLFAYMYICMRL